MSDRERPAAYAVVEPTDLLPQLVGALRNGAPPFTTDCGRDVWTCRVCGASTTGVVVVPYASAWRHAVEPLCREHYPDDRPPISTSGWPGPSTPTLGARRRLAEATLHAAISNAEAAAREVDRLFGGEPGRWTLDGREVTEDASIPLLSLHDYLNDIAVARAAITGEATGAR